MVKVRVINKFCRLFPTEGIVSERDWKGNSFWVPISIHGEEMMLGRRNLEEVPVVYERAWW